MQYSSEIGIYQSLLPPPQPVAAVCTTFWCCAGVNHLRRSDSLNDQVAPCTTVVPQVLESMPDVISRVQQALVGQRSVRLDVVVHQVQQRDLALVLHRQATTLEFDRNLGDRALSLPHFEWILRGFKGWWVTDSGLWILCLRKTERRPGHRSVHTHPASRQCIRPRLGSIPVPYIVRPTFQQCMKFDPRQYETLGRRGNVTLFTSSARAKNLSTVEQSRALD